MGSINSITSELSLLGPRVNDGCARHGWSVTIDALFDADLDFHTFPYDHQMLPMTFFNPFLRHVHFQPLPGMLGIDGNFQDVTAGEDLCMHSTWDPNFVCTIRMLPGYVVCMCTYEVCRARAPHQRIATACLTY